MTYVYKGTKHDAPEPLTAPAATELPARDPSTPGPKPRPGVFDPSKCGEARGYRQHQRYGTEACDPCLAANAVYHREWSAATNGRLRVTPGGFRPDACGTYAGYCRHLRHKVPVCGPCAEASRVRSAEYRAERRAAA